MQATARAGANIALIKYWGKRDAWLNLPAAGSLSATLDALQTRTTVTADPALASDELELDGRPADPQRITPFLDLLRVRASGGPFCRVESANNFPTGAGLASSASGFAALALAGSKVFGLDLEAQALSELARRGSGSAARSIFGGFVEMAAGSADDGQDCVARPLLSAEAWPLDVVIAVTDRAGKAVSSTDGMNHTMQTSPYYPAWVASVDADLATARRAINARDFQALADVAEASALTMHASALAARPGLIYFNPATLACLHAIRGLRAEGCGVFFTVDAGPQVKAFCLPGHSGPVVECLGALPGVERVVISGLGKGAELL